jgi:hypothetical protein
MFKQTFETATTPHITVNECRGNLVVQGTERRQVDLRLQGEADHVTLEQEGDTFVITAPAGCHITCPEDTVLTIGAVMGNLKVEGVKGQINVETVYGNATLRAVGPTVLGQTFGGLRVRRATGDLQAQVTRGDARIRHLAGSLSMERVDGNLTVDGLEGELNAGEVQGNVRLGALFSPGQTHRVKASGNVAVYVPVDAGLSLSIQADGNVRSSLPGLILEETDDGLQGVLGDGEASLEARAKGNVSLRLMSSEEDVGEIPLDFVADLEGIGGQIEARISEAMAQMEVRLEESLGRIDSEQIRLDMERVKEQAMRRTEEAAKRTRRVAEREAERARMRAERAERRWRRASGRKERRPRREPATDEERMRVLRMVEEGKLTPEQAAELLAALEGRS